MYGKGMSYNVIRKFLEEINALSLSSAQISGITDRIIPEMGQWQLLPFETMYSIIWFNAIRNKIKS